MKPGELHLIARVDVDFRRTLTYKDSNGNAIDLTGYDAELAIRSDVSSSTDLARLTVANGGITLGGTAGTIDLHITGVDVTSLFSGNRSQVVLAYDLKMIPGSADSFFLVEGDFIVEQMVTRA